MLMIICRVLPVIRKKYKQNVKVKIMEGAGGGGGGEVSVDFILLVFPVMMVIPYKSF